MEDSGIDSGDHNAESHSKPNGSDSSSTSSSSKSMPRKTSATSRQLQRKLEARIEQAKRLHQDYTSTTPALIPIQRLPIPGAKDQQPLVQWDTDDSEEDIVNFFPNARRESKVTDTFSIEEMSISGDDEEEDLHLVPPRTVYKTFECCLFPSCTII